MRATKVLLASGTVIFAIFFFGAFTRLTDAVDVGGPAALGTFELFGAIACLYLLSKARGREASVLDWIACAFAIVIASAGFAGYSITILGLYLIFGEAGDHNTKAAGTVATAVAIQALWAPMVFAKLSFLFLEIDAGVVGWLISLIIPGASWSGTVVSTPSGHDVVITAACASFHNLSLASLCWVTLTMLHRPYWVRSDIYTGLVAVLIQFGFNVWRLTFVCFSLPMYEFWHEGLGKHIFSAVATACAIIFVQVSLVLRDRRDQQKTKIRVAAIS
jgi:hypothetical protein